MNRVDVAMGMFRRVLALIGTAFYGSLDRVAGALFDDPDYPDTHDPLAS